MKAYRHRTRIHVPRPLEEVFEFFTDAGNLQEITPDWLDFEIVTPRPIEMGEGVLIDYRLKVHGLPMRWRSEIALWDPPHAFRDVQVRGPYRLWDHLHTFERADDGGTWVGDDVRYAVWCGRIVVPLFVRRDVRRIFDHRTRRLQEIFAAPDPSLRTAEPVGF